MTSRLWVLPHACVLFLLVGAGGQVLRTGQIQPLDVKTGLWEVTHSTPNGSMPATSPPLHARLTPQQRAKLEELRKERAAEMAKGETTRTCITKEKLARETPFGENRPSCKRTVLTSTSSKLEVQEQCTQRNGTKMNVTFRVEALNSENVRGVIEAAAASGANPAMKANSNITGKWISAACGDVK